MTVRIDGALAVVTGGASGIGSGLAWEAARRGARVVVADVDGDAAERTASALTQAGHDAAAYAVDVTDPDACRRLAAAVVAEHEPVNLLFANAGVIRPGSSWTTPNETWRAVLDVNLFGVVNTLAAFVPGIMDHGRPAHLVTTASVAGLTGAPGFAAYAASKHAVVGLTKGLRVELDEAGAEQVGVSVLCPGGVDTDIWRNAGPVADGLDAVARRRLAVVAGERRDQAEPAVVAALTLDAVEEGRFWVVPIEQHHRDSMERLGRTVQQQATRDGKRAYGS